MFGAAQDFAHEQGIRHWLSLHAGQVTGVDYGQEVHVQLELPEATQADWLAYGRVHCIKSSQGDCPHRSACARTRQSSKR